MSGRVVILAEINPGPAILGFPPAVTLGTPFTFTPEGSGGSPPYVWGIEGSLPPGYVWDGATHTISGTATVPGSYPITLTIKDAQRAKRKRDYVLRIAALPLTITNDAPGGNPGDAYDFTYTATGGYGTYTFSHLKSMPPGLTLEADGQLHGVLTTGGVFNFVVIVTDQQPVETSKAQTIDVAFTTLTLTGTYPTGSVGVTYSHDLAISGGGTPYSNPHITAGALPDGLALSIVGTALRLSGTPTVVDFFSFTAAVDSNDAQTATSPQTVSVVASAWDSARRDPDITLSVADTIATSPAFDGVVHTLLAVTGYSSGKHAFAVRPMGTIANAAIVIGVTEDTGGGRVPVWQAAGAADPVGYWDNRVGGVGTSDRSIGVAGDNAGNTTHFYTTDAGAKIAGNTTGAIFTAGSIYVFALDLSTNPGTLEIYDDTGVLLRNGLSWNANLVLGNTWYPAATFYNANDATSAVEFIPAPPWKPAGFGDW